MFRFFRQIRKKLTVHQTEEQVGNNTQEPPSPKGRYLLYAMGEIFLVVVGILIALQVNNWNEEKSMRVKEQFYLAKLLEDFRKNKIEAKEKLQFANDQTSNVDLLLASINNPNKETDDEKWMIALNHAWFLPHPVFEENTWEELHSTGDLSIIQNTNLTNDIANFYRSVETTLRLENEWGDFHLSYRNKVNEIMDHNLRQSIFIQIITGENDRKATAVAQPYILKLTSIPGVMGILSDIRMNRYSSINAYQNLVDNTSNIISQLEQELGLGTN